MRYTIITGKIRIRATYPYEEDYAKMVAKVEGVEVKYGGLFDAERIQNQTGSWLLFVYSSRVVRSRNPMRISESSI
jgi:hypothetical protein